MSFDLKELAILAPFQLSTLAMMGAVGFSHDFPERTAEVMTLPATGMVLGAALIAGVCYSRVRRDRIEEKKFAGNVEEFLAGGV
jgi:hypothetical protein